MDRHQARSVNIDMAAHRPEESSSAEPDSAPHPAYQQMQEKLDKARQRMLSAAVAFCDGLISAGQLRAVREMLREQELRFAKLEGEDSPPFVQPAPPSPTPTTSIPVEPLLPAEPQAEAKAIRARPRGPISEELQSLLGHLDEKVSNLEADFQQGRINASQYRAIRRHYMEQHEVALRLHQANPNSDRWRIVLEEGKTTFLMQLNEAECRCIALYDMASRDCILLQGDLPNEAEEAMRFLSTFGQGPTDQPTGRMFATQTDDGANLLLIPGRYTAALVAFSDEPPGWQVRALREVLRNFEAANTVALDRGERKALVFPNLNRFFRD